MTAAHEWQFDGLVGPTHNYAGLATGNLAAASNAGSASNPRLAALQGLKKMRFVRNLGVKQAFFPPHYRPLISELRRLGFSGDLGTVLDNAFRTAPGILASVYSSSFMWAANAATVTSSVDNLDGRLHLTPANLSSHYHRSVEAQFQQKSLKSIFHNKKLFCINNALPSVDIFGDEGAANHMLINYNNNSVGFNIFVYGKSFEKTLNPQKYLARQQLLASQSVARIHGLDLRRCLFFQQSPEAIDQGVFHNDVIALSTTSRMIVHEHAFVPEHQKQLRELFIGDPQLRLREVTLEELSIQDAVATYLFNSQLLELPGNKFVLVAPSECSNHAGVGRLVRNLKSEGVLDEVHYLDVRESMRNGGGPACLRLRVVMNPEQEEAIHQGVILTEEADKKLQEWVNKYYRDRLEFSDLRDPNFVNELDAAYEALEVLIGMPGLYDDYRQ